MKKAVTFEVNGDIYSLRLDVNALCKIEDILGKPMSELGESMGLKDLRIVFSCGLSPKVSLEEAGDVMTGIIEEKGVEELNSIIEKAIQNSFNGGQPLGDEVKKKVAKAKR